MSKSKSELLLRPEECRRDIPIPDLVFEEANKMIAANCYNGISCIDTKKLDDAIHARRAEFPDTWGEWTKSSGKRFPDHWMNIEPYYRSVGWNVVYDTYSKQILFTTSS